MDNLPILEDTESICSVIWIAGQYCGRIKNADSILKMFVNDLATRNSQIQLSILTAAIKLLITRPSEKLAEDVLKYGTEEADDPDIRDRAYIYSRLLSKAPEAAKVNYH